MHGVTLPRKIKCRNDPLQVLSLYLLFPKARCQPVVRPFHKGTDRKSSAGFSEIQGICSQCDTVRFKIVPILLHSSANTEGLKFIRSFMVPGKAHSWSLHHIPPSSKLVKTIYIGFYCFAFLQTSFNPGSAPPSQPFFFLFWQKQSNSQGP